MYDLANSGYIMVVIALALLWAATNTAGLCIGTGRLMRNYIQSRIAE
jgi:hypothetical protein